MLQSHFAQVCLHSVHCTGYKPSQSNRQSINLQTVNQILLAVNQSCISTFGEKSVLLDLGLRRAFRWVFVVATMSFPILEADFSHHFNLSVNLHQQRLNDNTTNCSTVASVVSASAPSPSSLPLIAANPSDSYTSFLTEFHDTAQPHYHEYPITHNITHHITTTGSPPFSWPRHLASDRYRNAKQEFEHMLSLGIILESSSNFSLPFHLVPKAGGD